MVNDHQFPHGTRQQNRRHENRSLQADGHDVAINQSKDLFIFLLAYLIFQITQFFSGSFKAGHLKQTTQFFVRSFFLLLFLCFSAT